MPLFYFIYQHYPYSLVLLNPIEKMKLTFLAWLFILCGHAISNMAFEEITTSQYNEFTLSEAVKHGQVHGLQGKMGLKGEDEMKEYKGNHELFNSMKGQKGGHGSSNIVHRPGPNEKSAATLLSAKSTFFFLFATMFYVTLASGLISFTTISRR